MAACGCAQNSPTDYKTITPAEVSQMMRENSKVIVIDVRTPGEYVGELGHISGTVLHPLQEIDTWVSQYENQKNQEIIMVCRSGNRSGVAAKYFSEKGFTNVYNMAGGMKAWNKDGLPIEKDTAELPEGN